jgi:K+-transporting ATPase c subunit
VIGLKLLMSSTKGRIVREIRVQFLGGTILGQTFLISRPNSGLPVSPSLRIGRLAQKKNQKRNEKNQIYNYFTK